FYSLFELTGVRHRFSGESPEFFQDLIRDLSSAGMARIYLSRYRGVVTSAAIVIFYGQTATYLYGGSLPFFPQAMSSYDLHWTAMRDARAAGCRSYDFYGIAPDNQPFHPYAKFTEFKKKFGGRPVNHAGAQDIIFYEQFADLWLKQMEKVAIN
ncbi:MAG: peptidoglycan bridge formation glycyltransferase FemA/FemB family protein, partial [Candidatus Omnitrophica bacterium]|nr:peptidoglycan bridge formation glycyltransferase FemA/FemB family protein [Candidatus Omnitrophota bacterium]